MHSKKQATQTINLEGVGRRVASDIHKRIHLGAAHLFAFATVNSKPTLIVCHRLGPIAHVWYVADLLLDGDEVRLDTFCADGTPGKLNAWGFVVPA